MSSLEPGSPLEKNKPDDTLSEFDRKVFGSISKALWLPDDFKEYMVQYLSINGPAIPIGQIIGFTQFTAQAATVDADESTTSTSYTDLATAGPAITGLPAGSYVVLAGGYAAVENSGTDAYISVRFNAVAEIDYSARTGTSSFRQSVMMATLHTFEDPNNTVTVRYRVAGATTGHFGKRWLIVIRYANA